MESIVKQIEYLRNEIGAVGSLLMVGVFLIAGFVLASYITAVATGKEQLYKIPVILLITGVFFVARQEYMHHRPVPWVEKAEALVQSSPGQAQSLPEGFVNWETYHRNLKSRIFFLLPIDFLAAFAFFWIFYNCVKILLKTDPSFVWWSAGGLGFAVLWVFFAFWAADK